MRVYGSGAKAYGAFNNTSCVSFINEANIALLCSVSSALLLHFSHFPVKNFQDFFLLVNFW